MRRPGCNKYQAQKYRPSCAGSGETTKIRFAETQDKLDELESVKDNPAYAKAHQRMGLNSGLPRWITKKNITGLQAMVKPNGELKLDPDKAG